MANIIPPNNVVAGDPRHVSFHNDIADVLTAQDARMDTYEEAFPTIRGNLGNEANLPTTGSPGDMYTVGEDQALYYWGILSPATTPDWHYIGALRGEQGPPGPSGTIIGLLANGASPPGTAKAGDLFWVADASVTIPPADLTPIIVGSSAASSNSNTLTVPVSGNSIVTEAGDIAVLCIAHGTSTTPATPSGWENPASINSAYTQTVDSNLTFTVFTRVCPASMGNVALTNGTGVKCSASLMIFRNVTLGTGGVAEAVSSVITTTDSLTRAAPTLTPTNDSILCGFFADRYVTSTYPTVPVVAQPAAFTKAAVGGMNAGANTTSSGVIGTQGGYDLTVAHGSARPSGTQNWVQTGPTPGQLGAITIALAKKTA